MLLLIFQKIDTNRRVSSSFSSVHCSYVTNQPVNIPHPNAATFAIKSIDAALPNVKELFSRPPAGDPTTAALEELEGALVVYRSSSLSIPQSPTYKNEPLVTSTQSREVSRKRPHSYHPTSLSVEHRDRHHQVPSAEGHVRITCTNQCTDDAHKRQREGPHKCRSPSRPLPTTSRQNLVA